MPLNQPSNGSSANMDLLMKAGSMTEEDISGLRERLKPNFINFFDTLPEDRKMVMAALAGMSREKIEEMEKSGNEAYMVGAHDVSNHANFLMHALRDFDSKAGEEGS